jgi:adenylate kinase
VGDVAALHQCYEGRDEELDTYILDEDRLLDILEATLAEDEHDQEGEDGGMAVAAVAGSTIVDDARDYDNYSDELRDGRGEGNGGGGGIVMDYHASDLFPERWFDLVLVLRCDTATLFDRLTARGYSERKRSENVTAEIMNVALEEAREAYDPQIVIEVNSNTLDEMEDTIERVRAWMDQWILDNHHRQREGIHKDSSGNNHSNSE